MKRINVGIISLLVSLTGWAEGYTTEFGVLKSELLGMYIHRDEAENSNIYTSVVAGEINYTTPSWNHLSVTVAPYFSKKIGFLSGSGEDLNYDLLSSERESFIYLGEGYLRYAPQDWDIRIGRLALETPMANR